MCNIAENVIVRAAFAMPANSTSTVRCTVHAFFPNSATVPELIIYRLLSGGPCKLRHRNSKQTLVIR